ncbi:MAG: hypothetical protein IJB70_03445 [Clostridia bacterium]|nr:hypothetical protein [Clostridia bacterium]
MKKSGRRFGFLFRFLKAVIKPFYPKYELMGLENIPDEPCIIVANHTQMYSPIVCELYLPDNFVTWCAGEMTKLKEVPAYAFKDFWSQKKPSVRWLFKIASYLIAPLSVLVFNNARTIPVFRDNRIITTFKLSLSAVQDGKSLVIFPEHDEAHNNIVARFSTKFTDIARMHFKNSGKRLSFVPTYVAPNLKKMYFGNPIVYDETNEKNKERNRICDYLMDEITKIATSLPKHTVVPYRNISKKYYPKNTDEKEVVQNGKNKV